MEDFGFKYKIGDIVKLVGTVACNEEYDSERFLVVSMHLEQCSGGVQRAYACRGIHSRGSVTREFIRFMEIELEPSEAFKPREARPAWSHVKELAKDVTEDK